MSGDTHHMAPARSPRWRALLVREWLPMLSLAGLAGTTAYSGRLPALSAAELQVLFLLFTLFVAVRGLELSGLFLNLAARVERNGHVAVKLVLTSFFLSMVVTNDVALIVVVPLTLTLGIAGRERLVILEALAANAGSALTPFGNPQNLFIYWYYGVAPGPFMLVMAPLVAASLLALTALAARMRGSNLRNGRDATPVDRSAYWAGAMLVLAVLVVLRLLPLGAGGLVVGYAVLFNRRSLRVDYGLLLTFLLFFGIAANMQLIIRPDALGAGHVFALAALASQVISNVPAALLFAKFTDQWPALLWGVSVGAFGGLVGSLANLIAYRLVINRESARGTARFTVRFLLMNYLAFALGILLYLLMRAVGWYGL